MNLSAIADYMEKRDYESLVEQVLYPEFTKKDRLFVIKYLKRIKEFNKLHELSKIRLLIAAGNFDEFDICSINNNYKYSVYSSLFNICEESDIIQNIPKKCFVDKEFVSNMLHSNKIQSNSFVDWIWENAGLQDFIASDPNFHVYEVSNSTPCMVFKKLIYSNLYFIKKFFAFSKTVPQGIGNFKKIIKQFFYESVNCNQDIIVYVSKIVNLKEIFTDRSLKFYFESSCLSSNIAVVSAILQCGFSQITAGFNVAARLNNIDLVKLILPYKPRLDTASRMTGCNQEIRDAIDFSLQSRGKKKSRGNAS